MKKIVFILLMSIIALSFTGCGNKNTGKVSITATQDGNVSVNQSISESYDLEEKTDS